MATKEAQINLRLPTDLDEWVEEQAGGKRKKPGFIRELLERERAREEEAELQAMFDRAWDSLSEEEREAVRAEREEWLGAYGRRTAP
jgi:Arc/MetJ-type ribon-helix-helix transcriptional regulator